MKFKEWDEYEGQKVRPVTVNTGMIGILPKLEIKCKLKRDQLGNKEVIMKILNYLKEEGLIDEI